MMFAKRETVIDGTKRIYEKPNYCPHCGRYIEASGRLQQIGNGYWCAFFTCTVDTCKKLFFCTYYGKDRELSTILLHPKEHAAEITPELKELSAQFVKLYTQATDAESDCNFELAACGYRNAVEALVKDYAIEHKGVPSDEKLMRKPLQDCITDYLDGLDEAIAAYMIKEFGNTATHYPRCGVEFNFEEQKLYLGLFLQFMTGKLKILNVKRGLPQKHLQKFETLLKEPVEPVAEE